MNKKLLNVAQLMTATLNLSTTASEIMSLLAESVDLDWMSLVDHADGHSLTPLLYHVWQEAGGVEYIPPEARTRMAQAYADNSRRNRYIRQELIEVHNILTEAGVTHLILKGWLLTEQLYSEPGHRVLYDHDFLVPADQAETGQQALRMAGFGPLAGKDEWIEKHLSPLWRNDGYEWDGYLFDPKYPRPVELHVHLWEQGWRGLQVGQLPSLWQEARTCTVAGLPMQVLSPEDTLAHLSMHFAGHLIEGEARLSQLLDLALFMQQSPYLDWERIWARTTQAQVGRVVYVSLFLAHQIFGAPLPPPHIWRRLASITPPPLQSWLVEHGSVDVLTSDYRRCHRGQDYHLTFLATNSWRERLGIIRFALLPPIGQLMVKYNLRYRWLGPLFYPRYVIERLGTYGRGWFGRHQS